MGPRASAWSVNVDNSRLLIALGLSLVVLLVYERLVYTRYGSPKPVENAAVDTVEPTPQAPAQPQAVREVVPAGDALIAIETDLFRAVLTPLGGRLAGLTLKQYRESVASDSAPLQLVDQTNEPMLRVALPGLGDDAAVRYAADKSSLILGSGETGDVVFTGEGPGGVHLEKRFTFHGGTYVSDLSVAVTGEKAPRTAGLVLTAMAAEHHQGGGNETALELTGGKLQYVALSDLADPDSDVTHATPEAPTRWAGFAAQYFLAAVVPETAATAHLTAGTYLFPERTPCAEENTACSAGPKRGWRCRGSDAACDGSGTGAACTACIATVPTVRVDQPLKDGRAAFALYFGPKDAEVLARAGHDLDRAIDLGWFWFVALPLLEALRFLHRVVGNWGVAIIVLTSAVKVLTIPLTQVTYKNMKEMQKIQPQMQRIRERFKQDPQAMQKEMLELYRRHRVNPVSGCLPMLLQLPIFVGLYNALMYSIELRHAPFALWINDLSAPDRLAILGISIPVLTIIMGATMFVQQWLTPPQGDPTQQRIMMFMPLLFTYMFINFPAGLVLYWLVNNVITIGQQYWMLRST
jgi:YidC/Oxa1 family membrane protein insertase